MQFDYSKYKKQCLNKGKSRYVLIKYISLHGDNNLEDEPFFNHLMKIKPVDIFFPIGLQYEFNYDFLLQLVAGSLSVEYELILLEGVENTYRLSITVNHSGSTLTRYLDDLEASQIIRLYEILINEIWELYILIGEDEFEKDVILDELNENVAGYIQKVDRLKVETEYLSNCSIMQSRLDVVLKGLGIITSE